MLPVELSLAIFRYFDEYDWTDLRSVCKNWSSVISVLRNRQAKRHRIPTSGTKMPGDNSSEDRSPLQVAKKFQTDSGRFHLARRLSTSALGASSGKKVHKLGESNSKERKNGHFSKMERMGKQFKSSSLLTRKRRNKESPPSSSDTDGEADASIEENASSPAPKLRKDCRKNLNFQKSDESVYCSWSDDDDDIDYSDVCVLASLLRSYTHSFVYVLLCH